MRVYCEVCDTDDIPETMYETADGVSIALDTTANDHCRIWHPGEWLEMDTTDMPRRVVLRRDTRAHSGSSSDGAR